MADPADRARGRGRLVHGEAAAAVSPAGVRLDRRGDLHRRHVRRAPPARARADRGRRARHRRGRPARPPAIGAGPRGSSGCWWCWRWAWRWCSGGGPILVTEAAVSAILLVLIEPTGSGVLPGRIIEALIGGGVALAISALAFPQDPVLLVGRSVQSIFGELGGALGASPTHLSSATRAGRGRARGGARPRQRPSAGLRARARRCPRDRPLVPGRRSARPELVRYARSARHIDYAVRNARVLARHVARYLRSGGEPPDELALAVRDLTAATWALAADTGRVGARQRRRAPARHARGRRATQQLRRRARARPRRDRRAGALDRDRPDARRRCSRSP